MKQPVIGIVGLWDEQKQSYWMLPNYLKGIEQAGGVPIILPYSQNISQIDAYISLCDGFLLTGGQDVTPSLYHSEKSPFCGEICVDRDHFEGTLVQLAMKQNKPIFGICRGLQFLNVLFGGTLYQDLPTEYGSSILHSMQPPFHREVHRNTLLAPLDQLLGVKELGVNSYHHQAIKELAPPLRACAYSEDGLVEGIYLPDYPFLVAVQWHPELSFMTDEKSKRLFAWFMEHCK